jgi:3-phenylpropionate/trans-cinnamate dioxygenase ferredoxin reductase component
MITGPIVIVGAGQSAAVAALALREHGYTGVIRMLGREQHRPYERPPLSKSVLVDQQMPSLDVLSSDQWARANVELSSGTEAVALDPVRHQVRLGDGAVVQYEYCLLATGGEARTLPSLPRNGARTHYIRTLEDALRLRAALRDGAHVVILGGGFLGLELAHSATAAGASVTVVESASRLLDRFVPAGISAWLESELVGAGVQLKLGQSASHCSFLEDDRLLIQTSGGGRLAADAVVVAIGLVANDALARGAGLEVARGGGILVDAQCRTSDTYIFACGDCTSQTRPGQAVPSRLESWQNANEQARAAAAGVMGAPPPVTPVPWFWTDQGKHNIQILGAPAPDLDYVRRDDPAAAKALWLGHRHGIPVHGIAINAGAELRAVRPLFERGRPVQLDDFHLPGTSLRAWAKRQAADAMVGV